MLFECHNSKWRKLTYFILLFQWRSMLNEYLDQSILTVVLFYLNNLLMLILAWLLLFLCNFAFAVLFVHLDEQMDSKTLVGSYICTEKPGEFKWHPGSLTQVCTHLHSLCKCAQNSILTSALQTVAAGYLKRILDCFWRLGQST